MSSGQRILKNSVFLTISQITAKIINFALILILTRYLGKDGFGLYSFTFAYVSIFFFLTHMGINSLLVRDVAKHKETVREYISGSLPLVLFFSAIFIIIVNLIPMILNWHSSERLITLFFSFYFLFDALGKYFLAVLRAFERMGFEAFLFASERFLLLGSAIYCWYSDHSLLVLVILFAGILGIKAVITVIIVLTKITSISFSWSFARARSLLNEAYPFALVLLFSAVSARLDLLVLKGFHANEEVAIYNTARKIIEAFSFLPENIYAAVFPSLAVFFISSRDKFNHIFKQTFITVMIAAVPICSALFVLAPRLIGMLFQPEFYPAYIPLRWLSVGLLVIYIRMAISLVLNTTGDQHKFALIFGIAMVVSVTVNLLLIPKYDVVGACIALIVSEIAIIVCSMPFLWKHASLLWLRTVIPQIAISGILFSIGLYIIRDWNIFVIIIVSLLAYALLLLGLKIVTVAELRSYRELFSAKKETGQIH